MNWPELLLGGGGAAVIIEGIRFVRDRKKGTGDYAESIAAAASSLVGPLGLRLAEAEALLEARGRRIETLTASLEDALAEAHACARENEDLQAEVIRLHRLVNQRG